MLFQYHTASEPTFGTLLCSRFRLSLSHIAVVIPGHGDKPLFPRQVPLSLPFQGPHFPCCVLVSESIHPASWGGLHSELFSPGALHCGGGGVWDAQRDLRAWIWCAESHVTSGFPLGSWNLWVLLTTQSLCGMLKCPVSKLEPDQG